MFRLIRDDGEKGSDENDDGGDDNDGGNDLMGGGLQHSYSIQTRSESVGTNNIFEYGRLYAVNNFCVQVCFAIKQYFNGKVY